MEHSYKYPPEDSYLLSSVLRGRLKAINKLTKKLYIARKYSFLQFYYDFKILIK